MSDSPDEQEPRFKRRSVIAIGALGIVGIGTGVSFANTSSSASFGVAAGDAEFGSLSNYDNTDIGSGPQGESPSISGVTGTPRSVEAGDLYYVEDFDPSGDAVWFNLVINNAGSLSSAYNYLNFEIGVYVTNENSDASLITGTEHWDEVTPVVDLSSLSLTRGDISFIFEDPGGNWDAEEDIDDVNYDWDAVEHVALTVKGGSSYIYDGQTAQEPEFFLEGRDL